MVELMPSVANADSAEAVLSIMEKWAASVVADGTRSSRTAKAEKGERRLDWSPLFDGDALPLLFRQFLVPATRHGQHDEPEEPALISEVDFAAAKIRLEKLLHRALPSLVSDVSMNFLC